MRFIPFIICCALISTAVGQDPKLTPTDELRVTVSEWVATMEQIQEEENEWAADQEVLTNYREGLGKEIIDLKEKIADAKTRKAGADAESLNQTEERDRFAKAKAELGDLVRGLEDKMMEKVALIPAPLKAEPKVAQGIEDLRRDSKLSGDQKDEGISKRLLNLINLTSEIEKFQQTVVLRQELHKDSAGKEYNMEVVYFGLGAAYAINGENDFALVGSPSEDGGWKFEEKSELADEIRRLIGATTGDMGAAFVYLPYSRP